MIRLFLIILLICHIVSCIGFIEMIYFISYGYGLSISAVGLFLLLKNSNVQIDEIILGFLYIIYGLRLSLYLFLRNYNSAFRHKMKDRINKKKDFKLSILIMIWTSVSLLYACQASPLAFKIISEKKEKYYSYIGIIITLFGLILEILADNQKSAAKKINPNRFVDSGLYKIVRCPNYFGEMIFWTGNFISGIKIYNGIFQWTIVLLGYIGIIYVMFSGARRIEIAQKKDYGENKEFLEYINKTPLLIPFVPIYSVEKYTWLKA